MIKNQIKNPIPKIKKNLLLKASVSARKDWKRQNPKYAAVKTLTDKSKAPGADW